MSTVEYQRQRREWISQGLWGDQFVSPGRTVAHIKALRAAGMSLQDITNASRVAVGSLMRIERGQSKVRADTEDRVLAVQVETVNKGQVRAFRARRRIEALMCLGYSSMWIADRIGANNTSLTLILAGKAPLVRRRIWLPLWEMFEHIGDTPREATNRWEQSSIEGTKTRAIQRGYAPPAAWDDIDNIRERPKGAKAA